MKMRVKSMALMGAVALALATSSAAQAANILSYTFNPGSIFDLGGGNTYAATGGFDFDVDTLAVTNVTYEAVQIGTGNVGPYIFTIGTAISPTQISFSGDCCGDVNDYFFDSPLTGGGTINIIGASYLGSPVIGSGSITAGAVPEASTWAMFTLGFGGLGLVIRNRRKQQAVATAG